jgi:hypothetical protein
MSTRLRNVSVSFGAVTVHVDGRVDIQKGVTLDDAAKAFWDGVQKMGIHLRGKNTVEALKELADLFDCGCTVSMGEDDITVEGYDYHPDSPTEGPKAGSTVILRTYSANYEETLGEGGERWKDTITPLIAEIKKEQEQRNGT